MKTQHLQSLLARNAMLITFYIGESREHRVSGRTLKQRAYDAQQAETAAERAEANTVAALARSHYNVADSYIRSVKKLSEIQKAIKAELRGHTYVPGNVH